MSIRSFFSDKKRVLGVTAAIALGAASLRHPARNLTALAETLGRETNTVVRAEDIHWEPAGLVLSDMLWGRNVLFLGATKEGAPRDVYRARVRVSYEGVPFDVATVNNLTQTALGDDHALTVAGDYAAFATYAFGQEQSVTLLDLRGEGAKNSTVAASDRGMAYLTNVQQTGTGKGVGRTDITFDDPVDSVAFRFSADADSVGDHYPGSHPRLAISAVHEGKGKSYEIEGESGAVQGEGVHAEAVRHLPKRPIFWAVDTVRAVPWIGPAPIAWLEEKTFAIKDAAKKLAFSATGKKEEVTADVEAATPALDTSQASVDSAHWPPAAIKSIWKTPEPGEGEWVEPEQAWVKRLPVTLGDTPPAPFMRTFVRPDEARSYSKVLLVAMDTRQLDLDMEAGVEDPKPLTGPPGSGRIPRDPKIFTRIGAAFNGGFKTEHGSYGMMVKKRVLLPPVAGAASVVLLKDGTIGMGSWGNTTKVSGIKGISDPSMVSFRQNLEALVDEGVVNPSGRSLWGFTLPDSGMQTERSGICVNQAGHMLYVWGDDVSAITLGKAMKMAGCSYGMHLDMNPHHTGLVFTNITELKPKNYKSELLSKQMEISPDRYIEYAPKDFFYMMLREPGPPSTEGLAWTPDAGTQPAPRWFPALWQSKANEVELLSIEVSRASFRLRAGTTEARVTAPLQTELAETERARVLLALTMGAALEKRPFGLAVEGKVLASASGAEHMRVLLTKEDGTLSIVGPEAFQTLGPKDDAIEVASLIEAGEPVRTSATGEFAIGQTETGRTVVARIRGGGGAAALAAALQKCGAREAVLLSRGASGGELMRSGTVLQPSLRYRETSLSVIGYPMKPRAFRFEPEVPLELKKKK